MINTVEELKRQMTRNMGHGRLYENGDYISTQPIEFGQHNLVKNWVNAGHDPNAGDLLGFCVNNGFPRSACILLDVGARVDNREDLIRTAKYWINQFEGNRYEQIRYQWLLNSLLPEVSPYETREEAPQRDSSECSTISSRKKAYEDLMRQDPIYAEWRRCLEK